MKNKKTLILSIVAIVALVCITVGISLAFFNYAQAGTTDNTLETGSITFLYTETSTVGRGIAIEDAFPVSNEEGKALIGEGNVFDFNISSTKSMSKKIEYEVTARKNSNSTLDEDLVVMYLTKVNGIDEEELLLDKYSELNQTEKTTNYTEKTLYTGLVDTTDTTYDQDYRLRMWITNDGTFTSDDMGKTFTITVNVYANASVVEAPQAKLYTIVNDANSNGTADIGDEINITGTNENFYVISNDGTNINALAKYNLYVGGEYNNGWTAYSNPSGLQDSTMLGYVSGQTIAKGTTAYSSSISNSYSGSKIANYVNSYISKLNIVNENLNATGRLIKIDELEELECNSSSCNSNFEWVTTSSYWTGSPVSGNSYRVWGVFARGVLSSSYNIGFNEQFGVRPVITIGV